MALTQPISATSWSLKMTVDLRLRSDTGNINQSPVSSMASSLTHPCTNHLVYIPGNKRYACANMRYMYLS